jgi:methylenetetrahydrofolate dehydrogenase (NADP+)/methenyltetrahydrofolate cyclohydrolase
MSARILDGKGLARAVMAEVRDGVLAFQSAHGRAPGLEVVLVGEDPASVVYTRAKERASSEVGIRGALHRLPASTPEADVVALVRRLNEEPATDGILIQLPLPGHIDPVHVLDLVDPAKDVDGFHPVNAGMLILGRPGALVPCTPAGCMRLLALAGVRLEGARATVIGRSNIVGKPMAELLLAAQATVTVAHTFTRDVAAACRDADVLVSATGEPGLVRGSWIKPGAVVIDVGISRVDAGGGKTKIVGDVAFDEARDVAGAITPVPGGVGPMTIAMLLANTLQAARRREGARGAGRS